ncbi:MAG: HAMP domain-containing histidine kinase [Synergistaceae bacterium]|jgi:signal transduction histidine kinase|nr:HAMP domain-containing histidine kinase [Synergistaceae bacterium]
MKNSLKRGVPVSLITLFVLAVLIPSVALSFLALRAAERESLFVERRLESALLAEVDLASRRAEIALRDLYESLERQVAASGADLAALRRNRFADVPFAIRGENLFSTPDAPEPAREKFLDSFGAFLLGNERLPVYEGIAQVYRKEMRSEADMFPYSEMEPSKADSGETRAARTQGKTGVARRMAESLLASDQEARNDAFEQASKEGFEIVERNVAPQAQGVSQNQTVVAKAQDASRTEWSRTVSRSRSFAEMTNESNGGLLPRLSGEGLELLFWINLTDGSADRTIGCTLSMEVVRDLVADVIPDMLSDVRLLTVLDDGGLPIVLPARSDFDWRSPFVAREISPLLPRWEVGAWLTDPGILTSRAASAQLSILVLVVILFLVIAVGSIVIIRMLSLEMRTAKQRTTFVASVSHELRTPLTSIKLFAELLLSGKQGSEERRKEYLRTMVSETDRLSHLVDNVLAFSRRGRSWNRPMRPICLMKLATDTARQLEPHLTRNGFTMTVTDDGPLPTTGDAESIKQVIMNLLSNAEKYSNENKEISVMCGHIEGFAVIEIADRGIGVEHKLEDKIFLEFFRGDDSLSAMRNGAGLGLSIARDIARRHGGDVKYAPRMGGGSVFSLLLPLREDMGQERAAPPAGEPES